MRQFLAWRSLQVSACREQGVQPLLDGLAARLQQQAAGKYLEVMPAQRIHIHGGMQCLRPPLAQRSEVFRCRRVLGRAGGATVACREEQTLASVIGHRLLKQRLNSLNGACACTCDLLGIRFFADERLAMPTTESQIVGHQFRDHGSGGTRPEDLAEVGCRTHPGRFAGGAARCTVPLGLTVAEQGRTTGHGERASGPRAYRR